MIGVRGILNPHFVRLIRKLSATPHIVAVQRQEGLRRRAISWLKARRRVLRSRASGLLARSRGTTEVRGSPLDRAPGAILVCRVNKRLGNTLFMTPLVRCLNAAFPEARIDVLVRDPAHRAIFEGLPGVNRVLHVPAGARALLGFILSFGRESYDLAIDPSVNATGNRIAISLCRARYKLGFAGPEQWVKLTHAAAVPGNEPHQARQAVYLLRQGIPGIEIPDCGKLEVRPSGAAKAEAWRVLVDALGGPVRGKAIGFFTGATGDKRLPEVWWREWARSIESSDESLQLVQILPPGGTMALEPWIPSVVLPQLDQLAALMVLLDAFVAADSGPMHLAAAAGTPTVGLFRCTTPEDYAPLGRDCIYISGDDLDPVSVAQRTLMHLQTVGA